MSSKRQPDSPASARNCSLTKALTVTWSCFVMLYSMLPSKALATLFAAPPSRSFWYTDACVVNPTETSHALYFGANGSS
jgi:hypothetical protein